MSANFLDTSGLCVGTDFHLYVTFAPPEPAPIPIPCSPHTVGARHGGDSRVWRIAKTVTTEAKPTLQRGWAMLGVMHVAIPPPGPPHPLEVLQIYAVIAASSAQPPLAVHGVTGQGQMLLTELVGFFGINIDCSDFPLPGHSKDFNLNSVKTSPTLGDYLAAIVGAALRVLSGWALAGVVKWLGGKAIKYLRGEAAEELEKLVVKIMPKVNIAIVRNILNYLASDPINAAINRIAETVQRFVDTHAPLLQ